MQLLSEVLRWRDLRHRLGNLPTATQLGQGCKVGTGTSLSLQPKTYMGSEERWTRNKIRTTGKEKAIPNPPQTTSPAAELSDFTFCLIFPKEDIGFTSLNPLNPKSTGLSEHTMPSYIRIGEKQRSLFSHKHVPFHLWDITSIKKEVICCPPEMEMEPNGLPFLCAQSGRMGGAGRGSEGPGRPHFGGVSSGGSHPVAAKGSGPSDSEPRAPGRPLRRTSGAVERTAPERLNTGSPSRPPERPPSASS